MSDIPPQPGAPPAPLQPPVTPQPVTPVPPVPQPVEPPAAPVVPPAPQPNNDVDVNQMIANIEADTRRQQETLRTQIIGEAEKVFGDKMAAQKQESDKVMAEMKTQLDALSQASDDQKRTVIEEYKVKLTEQAKQLQNIEGELSQRESNIPQGANPYRAAPKKPGVEGETLDPEVQKEELSKMYNAVKGIKF